MGARAVLLLLLAAAALLTAQLSWGAEKGKWEGVDKGVIEKFAKEGGLEPRRPLIDTDRGDLLLFVFLVAGVAGGFTMGYYYRKLFGPGEKR